jgi:hypothetical protein
VLEEDVVFEEIKRADHEPKRYSSYGASSRRGEGSAPEEAEGRAEDIRGSLGPTCAGTCLIGGEKAYNEMVRVLDLDARTYFRVWLLQQAPSAYVSRDSDGCANYQLFVRASPSSREVSLERKLSHQLRCPSEELPATLDAPRYLRGPSGEQKDFHYSQGYRVDHLWHNQAHKMAFTLQEPTVVRIAAPVHRHLEFAVALNQDTGPYSHHTVIRAEKEDHHTGIFAQLEKGTYHFKLEFMSDAALLQLPCQTVHLELAMMSSKQAKDRMHAARVASRPTQPRTQFALADLFTESTKSAVVMQKEEAIALEAVSASSRTL